MPEAKKKPRAWRGFFGLESSQLFGGVFFFECFFIE